MRRTLTTFSPAKGYAPSTLMSQAARRQQEDSEAIQAYHVRSSGHVGRRESREPGSESAYTDAPAFLSFPATPARALTKALLRVKA